MKTYNDGAPALTFNYTAGQAINGASLIVVKYPTAIQLSQLSLVNSTTFGVGVTARLEGSQDGVVWTNLGNGNVALDNVTNPKVFNNANTNSYQYYRILGTAGGNTVATTTIGEVNFVLAPFIASLHPKPTTCAEDADGDGINNHLDLDSDGDGCPDAVEAGVSVNAGAFTSMSASGGSIYTGGIPSGTANAYVGNGTPSQYGANGFFNGVETAVDSGIYNGTSTYSLYALSSAQNVCTDTDGDNVPDIFDLDDDNDGVLDIVELSCSSYPTYSSFWNVKVYEYPSGDETVLPSTGNFGPLTQVASGTMMSASNFLNINWANPGTQGTLLASLTTGGGIMTGVNPSSIRFAVEHTHTFSSAEAGMYNITGLVYDGKYIYKTAPDGTITSLQETSVFTTATSINNVVFEAGSKLTILDWENGSNNTQTVLTIGPSGSSQQFCSDIDTDNDGIPNRLDLDSDGDGCPDTKEAILYNHITEASIAGDVKNGSGGVVTSTVSTPNAMVPGPYGSNGFADALQSSTNPDAYKYIYTYNFVADNINVSTCDNKFLYDIDSDDDGIPDAVESPTCFYTETQAMDITAGVSSDFAWATANPLSNTYDDNTTYGAVTPAVNIQNKALVTFNLPVIDAAFIDYLQLNVGATAFGTGTWRLEGLDIMTNTWVSLSAAQAMSTANTNYTFTNTLQSNTRYHTYRVLGVTSVNNTDNARLTEFSIHYKNYNPSFHRTKMGCNSDGDNDGVPDYLDRDSDGDGCPDAVEAGIDKSLLLPSGFYNNGGTVNGDYVIVGGNYGNNGISDLVETTPDSGIINYVSTYNLYANNPAVNFCLDTDGDGVPDPLDIDDDNDGILDSVESPACFYTAAEANTIFRINSQFASPDDDQSDRDIQILHDGAAGAVFNFNAFTVAENPTGSNLFTIEYSTPVRLATLSVSHRISAIAGANAVVVGSYDGYNWSAALSPATLITATPINFVITTSVPYKYYKIQTGSVPGALAVANTIGEISSTLASDYAASAHPKPTCTNDTDGDGVLNHLDLDSDGDGCTDASESGTVAYALAQTGGQTSPGTVVNTSGTSTGVLNAMVGNNTPSDYSANGFYNKIESSDLANATYNGTYTYANAINALIATCPTLCYKPAITLGTILDTKQGITSLQRAGADNDNWPMVRKGAWTALESKTKGFVPNRLTIAQINNIPAANLVEGMMVYNITSDCLYINTDGTATGWKCFNTQTCP